MKEISYAFSLSGYPVLTDFLKLVPDDLPESISSERRENGTQELCVD